MPTLVKDGAGSGSLPVSLPLLLSPDSGRPAGEDRPEAGAGPEEADEEATDASGSELGEGGEADDDAEGEAEDSADSGPACGSSELDSDLEDVPLVCGDEWGGRAPKVAGLKLGGGGGGQAGLRLVGGPAVASARPPMKTTSVCVDLLSHAFRLRQETVRTAQENGHSLERLVSAGFTTALEVPDQWLRFYEVREVAPEEISDGARHIAVGIDESSFTLAAIEDMLDKSKQTRSALDEYRQTIEDQQKQIKRLEAELEEQGEKMRIVENEKKAAQEEVEAFRRAGAGTPSSLLTPSLSPRFIVDRGAGALNDTAAVVPSGVANSNGLMERMRAPAAIEKLRNTLQRQTQLVSEIERNASNHAGERWTLDSLDKSHDRR
eukprot:evm.model.scf_1388EXC.1 EVM.evm.TU.scf_1388EXC.1   scf_1388EXC:5492-10955(+)